MLTRNNLRTASSSSRRLVVSCCALPLSLSRVFSPLSSCIKYPEFIISFPRWWGVAGQHEEEVTWWFEPLYDAEANSCLIPVRPGCRIEHGISSSCSVDQDFRCYRNEGMPRNTFPCAVPVTGGCPLFLSTARDLDISRALRGIRPAEILNAPRCILILHVRARFDEQLD